MRNSDSYCPICGTYIKKIKYENHRCNPAVLAGIDAAHTRALRVNDPVDCESWRINVPPIGERIESGFLMLNESKRT